MHPRSWHSGDSCTLPTLATCAPLPQAPLPLAAALLPLATALLPLATAALLPLARALVPLATAAPLSQHSYTTCTALLQFVPTQVPEHSYTRPTALFTATQLPQHSHSKATQGLAGKLHNSQCTATQLSIAKPLPQHSHTTATALATRRLTRTVYPVDDSHSPCSRISLLRQTWYGPVAADAVQEMRHR